MVSLVVQLFLRVSILDVAWKVQAVLVAPAFCTPSTPASGTAAAIERIRQHKESFHIAITFPPLKMASSPGLVVMMPRESDTVKQGAGFSFNSPIAGPAMDLNELT
jgi:hypothetical protein